MKIPEFSTKQELFTFLKENKNKLIAHKKEQIKKADGIAFGGAQATKAEATIKGLGTIKAISDDYIQVLAVINTTNIMDSHMDVHIPGLWDKSLKENKMIMHLQEHKMEFDKIISDGDDLQAFTENIKWSDLGWPYKAETQALIFDSNVRKSRNKYMAEQYIEKRVKNHSVGMRYVRLALCINDEDAGSDWDAWQKYIKYVANKEDAEDSGYFWAVTEAKVIEGSAVPLGSNPATPTLESKETPPKGTSHPAPSKDTQDKKQFYINLLTH